MCLRTHSTQIFLAGELFQTFQSQYQARLPARIVLQRQVLSIGSSSRLCEPFGNDSLKQKRERAGEEAGRVRGVQTPAQEGQKDWDEACQNWAKSYQDSFEACQDGSEACQDGTKACAEVGHSCGKAGQKRVEASQDFAEAGQNCAGQSGLGPAQSISSLMHQQHSRK